ncbi:MAG: ATP-binding protein, partial [Gemmatimonadota bacterium]
AMEQDIDRLSKVANRFELIGRQPRLDPIDLHDLLGEVEAYFRARLPKRGKPIRLVMERLPLAPVSGNRTLLEWALENLVKNSIDALEGRGGRITLRVAPGEEPATAIVEVLDDGPGVPWALRKRIFETGISTKPRGWGVGLSLARRIVEDYHEGSLDLVSGEGTPGARFRITLPVAEEGGRDTE